MTRPMAIQETKERALECLAQLIEDIEAGILTVQGTNISVSVPLREYAFKVYDTPKKSMIDSAMDLLNSTPVAPEDVEHLKWIYARMVEVHGENPNVDYMTKMREILGIEPIYEWQWVLHKQDDSELCRSKFMTDVEYAHEECVREFLTNFEKDESTKRERVK